MNRELQTVVEYLEKERGIEREVILEAVQNALLGASKKTMTDSIDLRIEIDRTNYNIKALAKKLVVDSIVAGHNEITLDEAVQIDPAAEEGDLVEVEVTPDHLGRIAAQTAKQAIMQRIRQAEKERIYEEFKDRAGDVITGSVRRFDRNDVIIDLGRAEGVIPSRERVPTEEYEMGETIRSYIVSINSKPQGPQIVLSRSHPEFVKRLFELEVSEISDGTVDIKGIAREAGYRTKLAVVSNDSKVDPVGACVGMRGMRVKNIVRELSGEKIDIVRWNEDIKTYVANALAPAKLSGMSVEEATRTIDVVVDADQLSLAIGKRGQNARLSAKLTGWKVNIQKSEDDITFEEKVELAIARLAQIESIGSDLAEKLVQGGFLTLEGIITADIEDIAEVEDIDSETAEIIHRAAENAYEKEHGTIES